MTKVVFACVHNAGRSQMARAFFERLADPPCGVECPYIPGAVVDDWPLGDPRGKDAACVRRSATRFEPGSSNCGQPEVGLRVDLAGDRRAIGTANVAIASPCRGTSNESPRRVAAGHGNRTHRATPLDAPHRF